MSEFSPVGGNEGYESCDDDNQQELIETLKERENTQSAAGASPRPTLGM